MAEYTLALAATAIFMAGLRAIEWLVKRSDRKVSHG